MGKVPSSYQRYGAQISKKNGQEHASRLLLNVKRDRMRMTDSNSHPLCDLDVAMTEDHLKVCLAGLKYSSLNVVDCAFDDVPLLLMCLCYTMLVNVNTTRVIDDGKSPFDDFAELQKSFQGKFRRLSESQKIVSEAILSKEDFVTTFKKDFEEAEAYRDRTSDKYAAMLLPLVESCIPEDMLRIWLRNPFVSTAEESYSQKLTQLKFLRSGR
ncbi:hypothetical protein TNCV_124951 [Trichonephila clavipes]|nr:hypothetical protein TNCV_124951 [Trichonephila clavipes]